MAHAVGGDSQLEATAEGDLAQVRGRTPPSAVSIWTTDTETDTFLYLD